jgi:tRNA 2-thiouridine synthesizing protein A
MAATSLDLCGLKCPLPALKTRKALAYLRSGDELVVECTDPLAPVDIPNLLRETGDRLIDSRQADGRIVFRIQKS